MHDMDDRGAQRAGTRQQLANLGESELDLMQRQLAIDILALRVDHHDGRVGQSRRRGIYFLRLSSRCNQGNDYL